MRATPIGLAARDIAEAVQAARGDAELTHADPAAAIASCALCAALLAVRAGSDPLAAAREQARGHPRLADTLSAVAEGDEEQLGRLAYSPEAGACWTTLALGLYALVRHDDYECGVSWAIAQGGDTDTNAAVAGALLGARYGESTIPARWLGRLRERERVESAADALQSPRPYP
jgi:ADP-ribosylglycohydrolase